MGRYHVARSAFDDFDESVLVDEAGDGCDALDSPDIMSIEDLPEDKHPAYSDEWEFDASRIASDIAPFMPPGAVALPDNDQWTNRFEIRSESSDRVYTVAQNKKKRYWGCSCPGWRTKRKCKHLAQIGLPAHEEPYEPRRLSDSAKPAAQPSPKPAPARPAPARPAPVKPQPPKADDFSGQHKFRQTEDFEPKKYPELDKIVGRVGKMVETIVNESVADVESSMPYKAQYVLEELIKKLQKAV